MAWGQGGIRAWGAPGTWPHQLLQGQWAALRAGGPASSAFDVDGRGLYHVAAWSLFLVIEL